MALKKNTKRKDEQDDLYQLARSGLAGDDRLRPVQDNGLSINPNTPPGGLDFPVLEDQTRYLNVGGVTENPAIPDDGNPDLVQVDVSTFPDATLQDPPDAPDSSTEDAGEEVQAGTTWLDPEAERVLRDILDADFAEREAFLREQSRRELGQALADSNAQMAWGGLGGTGAQAAVGADIRAQAAQQLAGDLLSLDEARTAQQLAALDFFSEDADRTREEALIQSILDSLDPTGSQGSQGTNPDTDGDGIPDEDIPLPDGQTFEQPETAEGYGQLGPEDIKNFVDQFSIAPRRFFDDQLANEVQSESELPEGAFYTTSEDMGQGVTRHYYMDANRNQWYRDEYKGGR